METWRASTFRQAVRAFEGRSESGHRSVPHTADMRIEAWAPTREGCVAEAVAALVESFADASGAPVAGSAALDVPPGPAEDMLVTVLDEVIYRLEVAGELVLGTEVAAEADGGMTVRLAVGDAERAAEVGAVPKAVSLHGLRFAAGPEGWSCTVTVDV